MIWMSAILLPVRWWPEERWRRCVWTHLLPTEANGQDWHIDCMQNEILAYDCMQFESVKLCHLYSDWWDRDANTICRLETFYKVICWWRLGWTRRKDAEGPGAEGWSSPWLQLFNRSWFTSSCSFAALKILKAETDCHQNKTWSTCTSTAPSNNIHVLRIFEMIEGSLL